MSKLEDLLSEGKILPENVTRIIGKFDRKVFPFSLIKDGKKYVGLSRGDSKMKSMLA